MTKIDHHTRFVKIGRIVLPLVAVVLIICIFAITRKETLSDGFIFTDAELRELASGQKIMAPKFAGVTSSGDAFTLSAQEAVPDSPNPSRIDLMEPFVQIETRNALTITAQAALGRIDIKNKAAILRNGVEINTSNGFIARSDTIDLNFRTGNVSSSGSVAANGPLGEISSGSFRAIQNLDIHPQGGHAVLEFYSGVKLLYVPQQEEPK